MNTNEQCISIILIDIIGIVIISIIVKAGHKNIYRNDDKYTYIIRPTNFIKQLAIYGAIFCILGIVFNLISNIGYLIDYFSEDTINFYKIQINDTNWKLAIFSWLKSTMFLFALFFYFY